MKLRGLAILILALFLVGSTALVSRTSAAADKTPITATETFDPFGLLGPPVGEILSPGVLTCPGFEPTGNPLQPCPPDSRTHIRGMKTLSRVDSTSSLMAGWMTVEANANWDAAGTGPAWGTFSCALDAGGTWDGTWEGVRSQQGSLWVNPLHGSGQGTGGAVDGMKLMLVDRIVEVTLFAFAYTGSIEGRIVDPNAK